MSVHILRAATEICTSLEGILIKTFGPTGMDVLIDVMSTTLIATNHGSTIIDSIQISHPVGQLIINAVQKFHSVTGDGSTAFILMLASIMRQILKIAEDEGNSIWQDCHKLTIVTLKRALHVIECDEDILQLLKDMAYHLPQFDGASVNAEVGRIIETALHGKFGPLVVVELSKISLNLIIKSINEDYSFDNIKKVINRLICEFHLVLIEIPQVLLKQSCILQGIVLRYNSKGINDEIIESLCDKKFAFVTISFELHFCAEHGENQALNYNKISQLQVALSYQQNRIKEFVKKLTTDNIRLVISSKGANEVAMFLCNQSGIALITNVMEDDLKRIAFCGEVDIWHEWGLSVNSHSVGTASCKFVQMGMQRFIHLMPKTNSCGRNHQVLLCAPAKELARQYRIAMHNSLKCVRMWLDPPFCSKSYQPSVVPGAGATEFALSDKLNQLSKLKACSDRLAFTIVSEALLSVPQGLYRNSTNYRSGGVIQLLKAELRDLQHCENLQGVDPNTGKLFDAMKAGIVEPMYTRYSLFRQCLQVVIQILNIDAVIPALTPRELENNNPREK